MTAVELSTDAGLAAMVLLTANILLGLVLSARYDTVRRWPHRKLAIFDIHNWTAYIALGLIVAHPALLLFSKTTKFAVADVLLPVKSPHQISDQGWVVACGRNSITFPMRLRRCCSRMG
jgi:predicted ferric reductase